MAKKNKKPATRLNIKNAEASKLARELAAKTGKTITVVATVALREQLERVREHKAKLAAMREISAKTAELLKGEPLDHAEMLYDEKGLPK